LPTSIERTGDESKQNSPKTQAAAFTAEPPPLPVKNTWNVSSSQMALATTLMFTIVGSLVFSSLTMNWMDFDLDEEGVPLARFPLLMFLWCIIYILYLLADSILLFKSWSYLPVSKRPMGLHPALIVGLTYVPIVGCAGYFLAYGMLSKAWANEAARLPQFAQRKEVKTLQWIGFLLAGWLLFEAIIGWIGMFSAFTELDMTWWDSPLVSSDSNVRGSKRLLKILSLQSISGLLLAFWFYGFYKLQLFVWRGDIKDEGTAQVAH
jgi:hypothetical protein